MHSSHADSDAGLSSLQYHELAHGERRYSCYKGIGGGSSTLSLVTISCKAKNVYHRISCLLGIFWRDKQTRDNQTYNEAVSNVVILPCSLYECVAQLVEHTPFKCMVVSSILTTLTNRTGFCSPFIGLFGLLDNPQCGTKWPSCARHSGGHMRSKLHETEIAPSHLCFLLRYYLLTRSPTKRVAFG